MSWLDGVKARLRLVPRAASESRFENEMRFHVEMEAARLVREQGLDPDEARRRALAAFGGVENHREALRDGRALSWMTGFGLDLRLGMRMLLKYPGLTFVGVVSLSVAVVIGTFAFSAVNAITGSSLPLDEGDRIVSVRNFDPTSDDEIRTLHLQDLQFWREAKSITLLSASRIVPANLTAAEAIPISTRVAEMSASAFRVARVNPERGRYLRDDDSAPGAPNVVVIGHDLWQRWLAGRPDVLDFTIQVAGVPHTIVGIMPASFRFPVSNEVWTPLRLNPLDYPRGRAPSTDVFGRLADGASLADARVELRTIGQRVSRSHPATNEKLIVRVSRFSEPFLDAPGGAMMLHVFQVIVTLLLVVIGTNVAILVYARTASRAGEFAVRTALGAGRRRIVTQLFLEALALSGVASALGLLIARQIFIQVQAMVSRWSEGQLPYYIQLRITPASVVYVVVFAMVAAVIIGVIPALRATRTSLTAGLKLGGGASIRLGRTWTALLVAQVAISVAALPVALEGGHMWLDMTLRDYGTPITESVVIATPLMSTPDPERPDSASAALLSVRYTGRVSQLQLALEERSGPGSVARLAYAPGDEGGMNVEIERGDSLRGVTDTTGIPTIRGTAFNRVDDRYFDLLGVRFLAGRTFVPSDFAEASPAVIVSQSFVKKYMKNANALGRRIREHDPAPGRPPFPWREIVGVVEDFPQKSDGDAGLYFPLMPGRYPVTLAVQSGKAGVASTIETIRRTSIAVDPDLRIGAIRTVEELLQEAAKAMQMAMLALVSLATSVVLIAAAGIYALMSFTVARRRREIGIRAALGAGKGKVLREVLSSAMRQVSVGIVIGAIAAMGLARVLGNTEASWADFFGKLLQIAGLMLLVGIAASVGPARRALRIEPTEALKAE